MPLRDTSPLDDWVTRDYPPLEVRTAVRTWVAGLATNPVQAPSVPFPEMTTWDLHLRSAVVPGSDGVEVTYAVSYPDEQVDLLTVTSSRSPDA